ncbi:hypothetical protein OHB01_14045 [Microbispora hainanensis]|uniref:hypothetical protein n=1 Tax=Microbispora hainanensis TaxID=568844 RepID=UPI002E2ABFD9|nr:hypothetical protein [Microbispora hainanensis]
MATDDVEETLADVGLLEAVWRYRWSSFLIILLSGVIAAGATLLVLTNVTATARFAVTDPRSTSFLRQGVSSDSSYIAYTAQRAAFAQSEKVFKKAQEILTAQYALKVDLETLRESVQASPGTSGGIIEVQASARTDRVAANIANSVVAAYQTLTAESAKADQAKLLKSIKATETQIRDSLKSAPAGSALATSLTEVLVQLRLKESDAQIDLATYNDGTRFIDQANPLRISPSKLPKNVAIGLALGVLIAVVVSFLRATNPIAGVRRVTTGLGQRKRRRVVLAKAQPVRRLRPEEDEPALQAPATVPAAQSLPAEDEDSTAVYDRNALLNYNVDDEELRVVDIGREAPRSAR